MPSRKNFAAANYFFQGGIGSLNPNIAMGFLFPAKYTKMINALKKFGLSVFEGGNHTCAKCITNGQKTTVPRHKIVKREVVDSICKFLLKKDFKEEEIIKYIR